jgi:hypothetical protein
MGTILANAVATTIGSAIFQYLVLSWPDAQSEVIAISVLLVVLVMAYIVRRGTNKDDYKE